MRSAGVRLFGVPLAVASVVALAGLLVQACATGDTNENGDTDTGVPDVITDGLVADTGGDTSPDTAKDTGNGDVVLFEAGPGEVDIGQPCKATDTCAAGGKCTEITTGKSYCTVDCGSGCPTGTYCTTIAGKQLCAPDLGNQCIRCAGSLDCTMPTDQCVTAPKGDKFCARDCTTLGDCPSGFTCVEAAGYPGNATSGGDAGVDGGSGAPRICVPAAGDSCPCDTKRNGVQRTCEVTNATGTCAGSEKCTGASKTWEGCDARTPSSESCNGTDDDCDGKIDQGVGNDLCASVGAPPPNAAWGCTAATTPPSCVIGSCAAGWVAYPAPTDPKTGCVCPVDKAEPNDACAKATNIGTIADNAAAPLVVTGTISGDVDVDVFTFTAKNTANFVSGPNSFHVGVNFDAAGNPGSEFVFDVVHGATCLDSPAAKTSSLTSYNWCVDGSDDGVGRGESPCDVNGGASATQRHCADHTSVYFLRVHRKTGATPTCNPYKINITARGGPACDFAGGRCEG